MSPSATAHEPSAGRLEGSKNQFQHGETYKYLGNIHLTKRPFACISGLLVIKSSFMFHTANQHAAMEGFSQRDTAIDSMPPIMVLQKYS